MEPINFLCKNLGTALHTNVVTADGYEISNLLAEGPTTEPGEPKISSHFCNIGLGDRANGFMAEYFVKPPVDIVVQFPCLVDIDCVIVNCKNNRKVAQFDITTARAKPICTELEVKKVTSRAKDSHTINEKPKDFPLQYSPDISSTEIRKQDPCFLNTVGRFNRKYFTCDTTVFINPKIPNGKGNEYRKNGLKTINFYSLDNLYGVSHLVMKIYRMEGSTVIAINGLQVWGKPSKINHRKIQSYVYDLVRRNQRLAKFKDDSVNGESSVGSNQIRSDNKHVKLDKDVSATTEEFNGREAIFGKEAISIPEEFIDKITFDLMVLPVLLPSGHTIDSSTLEKCITQDRRNGRSPSDPFTGVPFSDSNRAVPNTSLKMRLDKFMLENPTLVAGKCSQNTTGMKVFDGKTLEMVQGGKRKAACNGRDGLNKKMKESTIDIRDDVSIKKRTEVNVNEHQREKESVRAGKSSVTEKSFNSCQFSHEDTLKESLEAALQCTVNKLPGINKAKSEPSKPQPLCCLCKETDNDVGFFKIPCNHVICRKCITKSTLQKKCGICHTHFNTHDLERVHFSTYFNS